MAKQFDPYRDALVVETTTIWSDVDEDLGASERTRLEKSLHATPDQCVQLEYIRLHTGFCRQISVTPEDLKRVRS